MADDREAKVLTWRAISSVDWRHGGVNKNCLVGLGWSNESNASKRDVTWNYESVKDVILFVSFFSFFVNKNDDEGLKPIDGEV